ncbi:MAG: class I SAM-dependent methyltransferase [Bacteroidetes bacterium]|nr:MAG: class I SAM-dependent methyltransferase [Bacteroidota bacterium]
MEPLIRNISDTARWVAMYRAEESERPDALFKDPFARKLAGERGEQIANAIGFAKKNSWSFVARTYLLDEFIAQHIKQGFDMIINLASGLDARPYRMDLPSSLQWVEIDLPGIMDYKESVLKNERPKCKLESIRLDLSDRQARQVIFQQLNQKCKKALVVSEGLIGYLDEESAETLSSDLSDQPHFRRWVFDLMSPGLLKLAQQEMGSFLEAARAPLKFAPKEGETFFLRYGWKCLEAKSQLKTAAAIKRLPDDMVAVAGYPEPEGPKGDWVWSGVCLFENIK